MQLRPHLMRYEQAKNLPTQEFKRLFGVQRHTFDQMVEVMRQQHNQLKKKSGSPKLSLEDQVLVGLQYWREYRTYFHISGDWGVSESTVVRIVHNVETTLIRSGKFRLPGKKSLLMGQVPETVVVDVTESPIERPVRHQKQFYSGKKKQHTFKSQLVIDLSTRSIVCTAHGKGRRHDFWLFQAEFSTIPYPNRGACRQRLPGNTQVPSQQPNPEKETEKRADQ